jgi:hypothetical protein
VNDRRTVLDVIGQLHREYGSQGFRPAQPSELCCGREGKGILDYLPRSTRSVPLTTISTRRLPQREQTSRLAPIEDAGVSAVPGSYLGGVGLDLMEAPYDQPYLSASV